MTQRVEFQIHRRMQIGLLAGVFLPVLVAAPAAAQTVEESAGSEEIIVTAQRNNQSQVGRSGNVGVLGDKAAEDVPFSVKSYNSALILNQQPQTLGQVLENDPSVRTTYAFGNAAESFIIRGFELSSGDVGLDGLYGIAPRQLIAPELYEQVQVLNGASAFLNGAAPGGSGIGGSVNIVPKRANGSLTRATLNFTSDEHFGGSFDFARRSSDGTFGVRVNGAARSGDISINNEFRSTYVIGGAFDYDSGPLRLSLDLAYQRVTVRGLRPKVTIGTATVPSVPKADQNYAQPWAYTKLRDIFGLAKLEYDFADNAMFYATFGARDGMEDGIYDGITVLDAVTGDGNGNALYVPRTDNNEAAVVGARVKLGTAVTQEINVGASLNWQVNRNAFDFLYGPGFAGYDTNIYNTPVVPIPSSAFVGGDLDDPFPRTRTRLRSVFASDTFGFWGDRVLVTGGLRVQEIQVKTYNYYNGGLLDSVYDESAITPVVGIVVKPAEGLSLFANRIQGLAQGPTAPIDPTVVNAGETFAPFKSTQYEFGGKLILGKFNASVAFYRTDLPSAFSVPVPGSPGMVEFGVFGKQRNRGIELSVDGEPVPGLRIIAGTSINDAKLRTTDSGLNEGNKVPGVPDYTANANVEWDVPFVPALTLTGRVVRTGKQKIDVVNTLEIPGWTRFDLGMRYVALVGDSPLTLRLGVDNVANKRFWASAFDLFSTQLLQGAPRTYKASISVDF